MANPIPPESREAVEKRDGYRCVRCAGKGSEWHHRRSRRVRDEYTHSPSNGVLLCSVCHRWAHANPVKAMRVGIILTQWEPDPESAPVRTWRGWMTMKCDGRMHRTEVPKDERQDVD